MTDVREIITLRLREKGKTMSWLSREIGRNHAYVQQFIRTHTPQHLELRDAVKVSKLLGIPLPALGVDLNGVLPPSAVQAGGMAEGAEAYSPPAGSFLAKSDGFAYFRARDASLDRHKLAIRPGDVVVTDISDGALDRVEAGDAVVVQLYHKPDCMTATTVLRQYVPPALLITNSSSSNAIWRMDDDDLPFEPVIKGRIVSVIRQADAP